MHAPFLWAALTTNLLNETVLQTLEVPACFFTYVLPGLLLSDGQVDFPRALFRNSSVWYQQTDSCKRAKAELLPLDEGFPLTPPI